MALSLAKLITLLAGGKSTKRHKPQKGGRSK